MLVGFFSTENISAIFDIHFSENPHFRDEFQALIITELYDWQVVCGMITEA